MGSMSITTVKDTIKAAVIKAEKTKLAAQLFRVARLTAVGVVAAVATGSAVDTAVIVAAAEAAFRQVFPS